MRLVATLTPETMRFRTRLRNLPARLKREMLRAAKDAGKFLRDMAQLEYSLANFKPNASWYRNWKAKQGFDTRPLLRTHLQKNVLTFKVGGSGGDIVVQVGFPESATYPGWLLKSRYQRSPRRKSGGVRGIEDVTSRFDAKSIAKVALWNAQGIGTGGRSIPSRSVFQNLGQNYAHQAASYFRRAFQRAVMGY